MSRTLTAALALAAILTLPTGALAAPIFYDFSSGTGGVVPLGSTETFTGAHGTLTASAFYYDGTNWLSSNLITRNVTNDNGLGVCSSAEVDGCATGDTGGGDNNELSQLSNTEAILLERPAGATWEGLWVSSLDDNGTGNTEEGTLYWGNSSDIASLLGGSSFTFSYPIFGAGVVEGSLPLPGQFFTDNALYVLFVPGGGYPTNGLNNDYLVWGAELDSVDVPGDVPVPEPASLLLLGSGLLALAHKRRRAR